jgi:NO-binding membrane sensor protein with MHYT domain
MAQAGEDGALRQLEPHWNKGMIAASIAISLLGAFTSTQLYVNSQALLCPCSLTSILRMCQARVSIGFRAVFVWTLLASLTFGFCSIWCLHFVAMLAYELDLQIGINVPLTILSAALAVVFTFAALASDLLYTTYSHEWQKKNKHSRKRKAQNGTNNREQWHNSGVEFRPLLSHAENADNPSPDRDLESAPFDFVEANDENVEESIPTKSNNQGDLPLSPRIAARNGLAKTMFTLPTIESLRNSEQAREQAPSESVDDTTAHTESGEHSVSGRSSSLLGSSSTSTFGISSIMNYAYRRTAPAKNVFKATGETLYRGCTRKNAAKGFLWSIAITSMHYSGLEALQIPDGHLRLNYALVVLSGLISWFVCVVGCILMSQMETHLKQQFLFSITATTGVAGMHFTGESCVNCAKRRRLNPSRNASRHLLHKVAAH